jgi:DNA-binding transcriptional MerR regulator
MGASQTPIRTRAEVAAGRLETPDLYAGFDADAAPRAGEESGREQFTIRDLTREFGVTARTLRFYEEKGLLAPKRAGQDRLYSRRDRVRLKYVLMGKGVGFSLEEIRDMLDLYDLGDGQATQLKVAHERFHEQIERLKRQRGEIDRALAELERARAAVAEMLSGRGA